MEQLAGATHKIRGQLARSVGSAIKTEIWPILWSNCFVLAGLFVCSLLAEFIRQAQGKAPQARTMGQSSATATRNRVGRYKLLTAELEAST